MTTNTAPDSPKGLACRGRKFWASTVKRFELTNGELELLIEVCRTLDELDRLAEVVAVHGATLAGSKGQTVINGAVAEARGQRLALHRLIAALALPAEDGASKRRGAG